MLLDLVLLAVGIFGFAYLVANARRLAARPERGTAWSPSRTGWLALSVGPLLIAVGAFVNLVT